MDYDEIGHGYARTRREDPRIAAAVRAALGDARTVVNVGAGAGSYEPPDLEVLAVEPSAAMRAQRPADAAPCIEGRAEALPFADGAFDAAMALLSDHHWDDRAAGLAELRRVARRRAVVFTWDPVLSAEFWLIADYLPQLAAYPGQATPGQVAAWLGGGRIEAVPVPHDCRDGFLAAYWRRPEAYLDPEVRAGMSLFSLLDDAATDAFVAALRGDLESGAWHERHAGLLGQEEIDGGYRLVVADTAKRAV